MRRAWVVAALLGLALAGCQHSDSPDTGYAAAASATTGATCDESLWSHVYHPARLRVINRCVTVTGVIIANRREADGDRHILLRLDPAYAQLTNPVNAAKQHGALVLEPVCEDAVTQADAKESCAGYRSPVTVPAVGTHVAVVGAYVTDTEHGWTEIHPVTSFATR